VVAREDTASEIQLVAYTVAAEGSDPSPGELRRFLGRGLPDYMVPSAFVVLETLPRTVSGKVDRKALPAPDLSQSVVRGEYVAPRTPVEEQIAATWAEVLQLEQVGIHDNFFDLGGHSLRAVQVVSRTRDKLTVELPLAALFASPTIAELANHVEALLRGDLTVREREEQFATELVRTWLATDTDSYSPLDELQPTGSKPPLFCVHGLGGHSSLFAPLAEQLGPDQPFYGLRAQGLNGQDEPHQRIEEMAACYVAAIRGVQPAGPYLLGGWSMGGMIALEMAQQLATEGEQTDLVVMLDSYLPDRDRISRGMDDAQIMRWISARLGFSLEDMESLPSDEQWEFVLEQARAARLVPAEVGVAQLRGLAQVCKSHLESLANYVPQRYAERIVVLRAAGGVEPSGNAVTEPGWNAVFDNAEIRAIPGGHLSMLRLPHVNVVAEQIARCLQENVVFKCQGRQS